jgi:hypothetical protein
LNHQKNFYPLRSYLQVFSAAEKVIQTLGFWNEILHPSLGMKIKTCLQFMSSLKMIWISTNRRDKCYPVIQYLSGQNIMIILIDNYFSHQKIIQEHQTY